MRSRCGRYVLVYNGEIYNFKDIRQQLSNREYRGHSDTEVLLEALVSEGTKILPRLNGMFALALYDREEQRLLLARDRFGIKPLFISVEDNEIRFGSEIKAIYACGPHSRKLSFASLHEYMFFGTTLGPNTMYENVRRVPPGTQYELDIRTGTHTQSRYLPQPSTAGSHCATFKEATERTRQLFESAVCDHLVSDVPLAVFLSGGVDSSAVTAIAARHASGALTTYSVGFEDVPGGSSDLPYARQIAKLFSTDHIELQLNIPDVGSILEQILAAHDGPFADAASIPLYLMARELSGKTKVVLQGDGGDELFGGYGRYRWLKSADLFRRLSQLAPLLRPLSNRSGLALRLLRILEAFDESDARLMALLLTEERAVPSPTRLFAQGMRIKAERSDAFLRYEQMNRQFVDEELPQRMLFTDTQILLPDYLLEKVDRSTMAFGIEARVPFLDSNLTDFIFSLPASVKMPGGRPKELLKRSLAAVLPESILRRPKAGFYVPYTEWIRDDLGHKLIEVIEDKSVRELGIFDSGAVGRELDLHRQGKGRSGFLLYKTLMLAMWLQRESGAI